jgi:uncharacterized tellurite resistance protein B-like protein
MIGLVKKMLGISDRGGIPSGEGAGAHRALVATTALLLEIAHIDGKFTDEEKERIVTLLTREYGLQASEVEAIMESARAQMKKSVDLWQFTSAINKHFSVEEKERVIEMIWSVVYADGKLDKYEDYLVHTLSDLLRLDHSQLIDAKLRARSASEAHSPQGRPV